MDIVFLPRLLLKATQKKKIDEHHLKCSKWLPLQLEVHQNHTYMSSINVYFTFFPRSGVKSIVVKLIKFPAVFHEIPYFSCRNLCNVFSWSHSVACSVLKERGRRHK